MEQLKEQVELRLRANVIQAKCAECKNLIFRDAWCTQERVIRFTSPFFRELFSVKESNKGLWESGDFVMYEAYNKTDSFMIECILSLKGYSDDRRKIRDLLLNETHITKNKGQEKAVLKRWDLSQNCPDSNDLIDSFERIINKEIPLFEKCVRESIHNSETFLEGHIKRVALDKYERNLAARKKCLEAKGNKCVICGIDFGKKYGPEFAGIIEVHHIVPISSIGKEYEVDPIKDLVPVCPNCHTALHSKKSGVYSVEELIEILNKGGDPTDSGL